MIKDDYLVFMRYLRGSKKTAYRYYTEKKYKS